MEPITCFICMSTNDPLDCDDESCECHAKITTHDQACHFIGLLKQDATEPCHYIHAKCLFHYHKHNTGMYFTCPGCKHRIVATSPNTNLFADLQSEQTKRYDHDDHVMDLVLNINLNLTVVDNYQQLITTLRQLCAVQHSLPVMLDAFELLYYRLSCVANTFIIHTHAILFFIIASPIDKAYKHEILKMFKKYGLEITESVLLTMMGYIRMFPYLQTQVGWNELINIIQSCNIPLTSHNHDNKKYCLTNVIQLITRAYPNIKS